VDYFDEAYEASGAPRAHYRAVLDTLGAADLPELAEELRGEVRERGVRYGSTGPGSRVRYWPPDRSPPDRVGR